MAFQEIISKAREYIHVPSVIRFEKPFFDHLAQDFSLPGYSVEPQGRLLVVKRKNSSSPNILMVHVDRHGLATTANGRIDYADFEARRYYGDKIKSAESLFKKAGQRFVGETMFAHDLMGKILAEGVVNSFSYDFEKKEMSFLMSGMPVFHDGVALAYKPRFEQSEGLISAQMDNAISVATAFQLVKEGYDGRILLVAEEEIGKSWQHAARYLTSQGISSHEIIDLDTTPYDNEDALKEGKLALRNKDQHGTFNSALVSRMKKTLEELSIPYDMKDELIEQENASLPSNVKPKKLGTTDLGRIVENTNGTLNGATLQIPSTKYHTNQETVSEKSLANYYLALKKILA